MDFTHYAPCEGKINFPDILRCVHRENPPGRTLALYFSWPAETDSYNVMYVAGKKCRFLFSN